MTFKKYNHTNNAFCELLTDLQSSDTTMMLTGNFNRLPTSNFIVKISKYQGTKCVARENIYVASRNNNICTGLVRAYEKVPMNDDAAENIAQALNFSAGDMVECVVSSKIFTDIQEELWNKLSKNQMRSGLSSNGFVVVEDGVEKITTGLPSSVINSVFSARSITEIAENHEFLLRKWNATEKINYPNFRNNLVKKFAKNPTSIPSANEYWNGDHWWNAIAVPNGGFFSLTAAKGSSSSGSTHLMYSATNDSNKLRWENVASVSASRPGDQWILGTTSGFCKPGFYRKKIYNQGYSGDDSVATIQIF